MRATIDVEHGWQAGRFFRPNEIIQPGQIDLQHDLVEEEQSRKRLLLRCRRHIPLARQMRKKSRYLPCAHLPGMAQAMETYIAAHPMDIRLLGAYAVMTNANRPLQLVKQLGRIDREDERCPFHGW